MLVSVVDVVQVVVECIEAGFPELLVVRHPCRRVTHGLRPEAQPMDAAVFRACDQTGGVTGRPRKSHAAIGSSISSSAARGSTSARCGYNRWVSCAMRYRMKSSQSPLR